MQTILAGGGAQEVEVYAADSAGRPVPPGSATAQIVDLCEPDTADDSVRVVLATSAAVVDSTATTTTAAAGPREADPRLMTVADASGLVIGRKYGIVGDGTTEAFELERVDGLQIYGRDALRHRFEAGAAVVGLRVSAVFPAVRADDADELLRRAPFGVDWTFVGVTGPAAVRTMARIERRGRALRATVRDIMRIDPQLSRVTHARTDLEDHLAQADLQISALLKYRGSSIADTDDGDGGKLAVSYTAIGLVYRVLGTGHEERAIWAEREAKMWTKMLVGGAKADDAVETTRTADQSRRKVRRLGPVAP